MSKGLVLITGVNGYIAAVTAKHILDAGFSVRGTVRRLESAEPLINGKLRKYAQDGRFEVVEVPDITVAGAFDEAVKGVTSIAHLATPVSLFFTDPAPILHAATNGTKTILNSALANAGPQLRNVIQMSSIAAVKSAAQPPYVLTEKDWNDVAEKEVELHGKDTPGPFIYSASKTAAEKLWWKFRKDENPQFAMTAINPVFVIGPPLEEPTKEEQVAESCQQIFAVFAGRPHPDYLELLPQVVDVRDVADLVLYSIEHPEETDRERYIASTAAGHPQAIADILRREMPEARSRIVEGKPGVGYLKGYVADSTVTTPIDSSKAERLLGKWISYEKSVVDTARAYQGIVN